MVGKVRKRQASVKPERMSFQFLRHQHAVYLSAHQLAYVARDPLTQNALQFLTHDIGHQITQRIFIQNRIVAVPILRSV